MSARRLPRQWGVVIRCDVKSCAVELRTALVDVRKNRAWAKTQGWLRAGFPRLLFDYEGKSTSLVVRDVCPDHAEHAKKALEERKAAREAARAEREAKRKAEKAASAEVTGV